MEVMHIYSFTYNELEFARIEIFLMSICKEIEQQHSDFFDNFDLNFGSTEEGNTVTPLELLMQLIAVWRSVYKNLFDQNPWGTAYMFEEPLARISEHRIWFMFCK